MESTDIQAAIEASLSERYHNKHNNDNSHDSRTKTDGHTQGLEDIWLAICLQEQNNECRAQEEEDRILAKALQDHPDGTQVAENGALDSAALHESQDSYHPACIRVYDQQKQDEWLASSLQQQNDEDGALFEEDRHLAAALKDTYESQGHPSIDNTYTAHDSLAVQLQEEEDRRTLLILLLRLGKCQFSFALISHEFKLRSKWEGRGEL